MKLELGKQLICPAGVPGESDLALDLHDMHVLEVRQQEAATVTKVGAQELMQAMVNGYGFASRAMIAVDYQLARAKKAQLERKAVIDLDVAPEYLLKKGLVEPSNPSGTEAQREAVAHRDSEYLELMERCAMLEAASAYLKVKAKGFEMTYQQIKKSHDSLASSNALSNGAAYQKTGGGAAPFVDDDDEEAEPFGAVAKIASGYGKVDHSLGDGTEVVRSKAVPAAFAVGKPRY